MSKKRKMEGKTDYKKRIGYLKSGKIRVVIRPSSKNLVIQAVSFQESGDKILITIKASDLRKLYWNYHLGNLPSSYLTGFYFGIKAKEKIKGGIIDLGFRSLVRGDRVSATIKGIIDSGFEVPYSDSVFPNEKRINGSEVAEFAKKLSSDKQAYEKQFSKYLKEGVKPEDIQKNFEKVKERILSKK